MQCYRCAAPLTGPRRECAELGCRHDRIVCDTCVRIRYYRCSACHVHHLNSARTCDYDGTRCASHCGHSRCDGIIPGHSSGDAHCQDPNVECARHGPAAHLGFQARRAEIAEQQRIARERENEVISRQRRSVQPEFIRNEIVFHPGKLTKRRLNRFMSAELEIGGSTNYQPIKDVVNKWSASVVRDGSIPANGFEINTAPAAASAFEEQMAEFKSSLAKGEAWVDRSCGAHVHIDCRKFDFCDVVRLMAIWSVAEPFMYGIVDQSRRDNHYCAPTGPRFAKAILQHGILSPRHTWFAAVYGKTLSKDENYMSVKQSKGGPRYFSLNLHSWAFRGTIENRMHHGTVDTDEIVNWCQLNHALADEATRLKDSTVVPMLKTATIGTTEARERFLSWVPANILPWVEGKLNLKPVVKAKDLPPIVETPPLTVPNTDTNG